jgi:hypothetical protein
MVFLRMDLVDEPTRNPVLVNILLNIAQLHRTNFMAETI